MKRFDSINMIPFIDIMLVLLAIVLTTATFISQGRLDINLPSAQAGDAPAQIRPTDIAIDSHHQLFCNAQPVNREELIACLDALRPLDAVTLRVDESVAFQHFVHVIETLKGFNPASLAIVTESGG